MKTENILKLDITLAKLSAIRIAANFWDLKNVKIKIDEFCKNCIEKDGAWENWINLMQYISKHIDSLDFPGILKNFPGTLKEDIKNYVYTIGRQLFEFLYHITMFDLDKYFGLKIYWTPFGTIDELRIVREWLKYSSQEQPLENCFLSLASVYTDDDLIRPNMRNINDDIISILTLMNPSRVRRASEYIYRANFYTPITSFSVIEKFRLCFQVKGLLFAARHFWQDLSIDQKKANVTYAAEECLRRSHSDVYYFHQQKTELLIFFMKQMSSDQILNFVSNNLAFLFKRFLDTWPHQEFCVNIIDNMKKFDPFNLMECFAFVIEYLASGSRSSEGSPMIKYKNRNVHHVILRKILEKTPKKFKLDWIKQKLSDFHNLHVNSDYATLSIVAHDISLKEFESQMMPVHEALFKEYVYSGNYKKLNEYTEYFVPDENEKKLFKQKLNFVKDLVFEGKIELATENLNWICDTERERKEIVCQVNPLLLLSLVRENRFDVAEKFLRFRFEDKEEQKYVKNEFYALEKTEPAEFCYNLLEKHEFDAANHYLIWRFETEDERRDLKKQICKSDEWLRDKCYGIWSSSKPSFDIQSVECVFRDRATTELLKFFIESEEEENLFRKLVLFDRESFVKTEARYFYCFYHGGRYCCDFMEDMSELPYESEIENVTSWIGKEIENPPLSEEEWWD